MNREIATGGASVYPLTGDVQSTPGNSGVVTIGLQGIPVQHSFPSGGEVLTYDGPTNSWLPETPSNTIALETNGTPNGSQTLLNLVAGTDMTITDDGSGNVTFDATAAGGITRSAITTNANGSYYTWSDGLIEAWGKISVPSSGTQFISSSLTFPNTGGAGFTSLPNVQVTMNGLPNSGVANDIASVSVVGLSTAGAGLQLQCSVPTGGGGTTFNQTVEIDWRALGQ